MSEPTGNQNLRFDEERVPMTLVSDGTTTVAQLLDPEDDSIVLAQGVARRRKGERRDAAVGDLLAIGRAYHEAGDRLIAEAHKRLS